MALSKSEIRGRLCKLLTKTNYALTGFAEASDCFCEDGPHGPLGEYRCDETAIAFIETAVGQALAARARAS